MARMIPSLGPPSTAAPAVRRVADRLAAALPDRCLIVCGARWIGPSVPGEPLRDGAADLAVLDPDRGVLLLDVRSGGLAFDPHQAAWRAEAQPGGSAPIADPFARLETAALGLRRLIGDLVAPTIAEPVCGFALVLPEALVPTRGLGPAAPASRCIDMAGVDALPQRIDGLFDHFAQRAPSRGNASPRWWWRAAEELFVAPRQVRLRLRERIDSDHEVMLALGADQIAVLDLLTRLRRAAITGAAGTGKTVLAIEKARMLARQGHDVLLTCYNKALGAALAMATRDERRVTALHFHELCWQVGGWDERRQPVPQEPRARQVFFDETLPASLDAAVARGEGPRFDAIVVDEGQDLMPSWWPMLDRLWRDPGRGIRYVFYDEAQCLREHASAVPGADEALVLRTNWRNTQSIHDHLAQMLPGMEGVRCIAPAGTPVEIEPTLPSLDKALRRVLMRLIERGGVRPDDIVVLTGRTPTRSALLALPQPLGPARLTAGDEPGCVRVRSIQAFKGLEALVVILAELDAHSAERQHALYYAGASRAQHHLVVLDNALLPEQRARGLGRAS